MMIGLITILSTNLSFQCRFMHVYVFGVDFIEKLSNGVIP